MQEINPSATNPTRRAEVDAANALEIIEFTESALVIRSIGTGRVWGIDLMNAGSGHEEVGVTELEPHSGKIVSVSAGPISRHQV